MSSSDDDDFGPAIPAHLLGAQQPEGAAADPATAASAGGGVKRERSPPTNADAAPADTPEQRATAANLRLLPSPESSGGRFERVYEHLSRIDDVACAGGAILTIDTAGVLRWWLKVPRGVFFASQQQLFAVEDHQRRADPTSSSERFLLITCAADDSLVIALDTLTGAVRSIHPRDMRLGRAHVVPELAAESTIAKPSCRPGLLVSPAAAALPPVLVVPRTGPGAAASLVALPADGRAGTTVTAVSTAMPHPVTAVALHPTQPIAIVGSAQGVIGYAAIVVDAAAPPRWAPVSGLVSSVDPAARAILAKGPVEFERWQKTGLFAIFRDSNGSLGASDIAVAPSGATFAVATTSGSAGPPSAELSGSIFVFAFSTGAVLAKIPRLPTSGMSPLVGMMLSPAAPPPSTVLLFDTPQTGAGPVLLRAGAFVEVQAVASSSAAMAAPFSLGSADAVATATTTSLLPLSTLRLLRAHAPPSQQLRDRVAATPLGATLLPDDTRRLFVLARGENSVADDPLVVAVGGADRRALIILSNNTLLADSEGDEGSDGAKQQADPRVLQCEQLWKAAS